MKDLFHYYHVYSEPDGWETMLDEHFAACTESGLLDVLSEPVWIGCVGPPNRRSLVYDWLDEHHIDYLVTSAANRGFEQVTLHALWADITRHPNGAVLYAHTKGVAHPSVRQETWRREMTEVCVTNWEKCIYPLEQNAADLSGAYHIVTDGEAQKFAGDGSDFVYAWLNEELGTDLKVGPVWPEVGQAIFAGNFWWSTTEWVAGLNAPDNTSRYSAETWVGGPNAAGRLPRVFNAKRWFLA